MMKIKNKFSLLLCIFCITFFVNGQDVSSNAILLEKSGFDNEMDIPFEKWQLSNGLKVLIHEDDSDPLVHVHITYHVGSNRESAGKSGFAHFFEHMMFQGSENVPDEMHFKIVNDAGGNMNGNTTSDRTVYFQTIPSNYLETVLWLESDRMGFLLDAVSQLKFENQRDAVKNEKYQNQINVPYGMSYEKLGQALYPSNHPYNWPVIGYVDDLDRATVNDLKDFFLRWYGPNNAILTVAGDVKSEKVISLVEKYFGSIPKGPEVRKQRANVPRLSSDVYTGYTDNVYLPLTDIVFPTVPNYHKDEAPLDILAALMGQGNNSIFYKNFVKSEKAMQVMVNHPCRELSGEFHFTVLSFPDWQEEPGVYFNNIESDIRNTIVEWEEKGFTDEDLEMIKTEMESQIINQKNSVSSKATAMSSWEWLGRGKYNISSDLQRYKDVTKQDVIRVYNKYIKNKKAVISTVKPKSPFVNEIDSLISVNPNADLILENDPQYENLVYNKSNTEFDACCRSTQPDPEKPKTPKIPDFYTFNLKNGINVIGTESDEIPKVFLRITIEGGALLEDPKRIGLSEFTASMMNESTLNYNSEEISVALKRLGSTIRFSADNTSTNIYIESLTKNLDKTLEIVKEKLFSPAFNKDDFERIKKQMLEGIEASKKNTRSLGYTAFSNQLFGETPFGRSMTEKTVKKIKLKHVQEFYKNYYSAAVTSIVAVGEINESDLSNKLSFLESWNSKKVPVPKDGDFTFPESKPTQIYLLDKEGSSQSLIMMGHISDKFDVTGDHFKSKVMNFPFGSGASGRLFLNLREDKGYTYGAYSFFNASDYMGMFAISTSVKTQATDSSLVEILDELDNYLESGITDEELVSTRSSLLNSEALDYESPSKKIGFLRLVQKYNLSKNYTKEQADILNALSKNDINSIAKSKIMPNKMAIVIVGNKYLIKKKLQNLKSKDGKPYNFKITDIKY